MQELGLLSLSCMTVSVSVSLHAIGRPNTSIRAGFTHSLQTLTPPRPFPITLTFQHDIHYFSRQVMELFSHKCVTADDYGAVPVQWGLRAVAFVWV